MPTTEATPPAGAGATLVPVHPDTPPQPDGAAAPTVARVAEIEAATRAELAGLLPALRHLPGRLDAIESRIRQLVADEVAAAMARVHAAQADAASRTPAPAPAPEVAANARHS